MRRVRSPGAERRRAEVVARLRVRLAGEAALVLLCTPLALLLGSAVGGALIAFTTRAARVGSWLSIAVTIGVLLFAARSLRRDRRRWLRQTLHLIRGPQRTRRPLAKRKTSIVVPMAVFGAIVMVLAAIAIPKFQNFGCYSKASEAKTMLKSIYVTQMAYHAEFGTYLSLDDLAAFGGLGTRTLNGHWYRVVDSHHTPAAFRATVRDDVKRINPMRRQDIWSIDHTSPKPTPVQDGCVSDD